MRDEPRRRSANSGLTNQQQELDSPYELGILIGHLRSEVAELQTRVERIERNLTLMPEVGD